MKRVGILVLLHESNTFLQEPTTLEHFQANLLVEGDAVLQAFRGTPHEAGGFLNVLDNAADIEPVGIFAARAMPYGMISADCWQELMARLDQQLQQALPLDGLLVAPHGATVAVGAPDADGDWLSRVRQRVGPQLPIVGTLDLHANVSPLMVQSCDALFGYRTNPHLDQFQRGVEAGRCLVQALNTGVKPCQHLVQLPLCVNIERQATSEDQGRRLWQEADRLQSQPGLLSVSCLYGFPYSDVEEMGATVIAVAENDPNRARETAAEMARFWWNNKADFDGQLISVEQGIQLALAQRQSIPTHPVGLLEMGDNVGGGSPGDGTWIAHGWRRTGQGTCLTVIADAEIVSQAEATGIGRTFTGNVGGKTDPERHGPPYHDTWTVHHFTDGHFSETEARHGGYSQFYQGRTAVLQGASGLTVIATTLRMAPLSLQQVLAQGVDPLEFAAIILKGVHAPVAAYAPICSRLIRINTRGVTTADLQELQFSDRREPLYPFETVTGWSP